MRPRDFELDAQQTVRKTIIIFHGHRLHPEPWLAASQTFIIGAEGESESTKPAPQSIWESLASAALPHDSEGTMIREHNMDTAPPGVVHATYMAGLVT